MFRCERDSEYMKKIEAILQDTEFISIINKIKIKEKDRKFCRHGMEHSLDVARIAYIINLEEKLNIDKEVIYGMALLHDIGRCADDEKMSHHDLGELMSKGILERAGFSASEIKDICTAIGNHKVTKENGSVLDWLLYRADKLSRACFMCSSIDECYWDETVKNKSIKI